MAVVRINRIPADAQTYDAVNAQLGVEENPPEGLILHSAGAVDGLWQVVDVWESAEHAKRFDDDRLTPALEAVIGELPSDRPSSETVYEAHRVITP